MEPSTAALDRLAGVTGALVAALMIAAPEAAQWAVPAATLAITAWIVWRDGSMFTIPDATVGALALIGVTFRLAAGGATPDALLDLAADVALTAGPLWLLREGYYRLRGYDGLGLGDVKLAGAAGCLVGAAGFAAALLLASLAGLVYVAARRERFADRIAFGVFLAPAIWVVWASEAFGPWRFDAPFPVVAG